MVINIKRNHTHGSEHIIVKTAYGELIIADRFLPISIDGIVFDNATSSKHICPEILESHKPLYATGHCPEDLNNNFFLMWLKIFFSEDTDKKAFRIGTWEAPSMSRKEKELAACLPERVGKSKYNRDYLCIPDYIDRIEPKPDVRTRYITRGIEYIEQDEILFLPKNFYFMGFDKAKE